MAIKAIWSIRHDDKEYDPGSILKGLKKRGGKEIGRCGCSRVCGQGA
ncbi:hypothetical protein [Paenibacillus larvae]|nr:hypothetical protein [Paenibacillus larvae]MDT2269135.1 hypothetical protein [Paenibacillus larvae]